MTCCRYGSDHKPDHIIVVERARIMKEDLHEVRYEEDEGRAGLPKYLGQKRGQQQNADPINIQHRCKIIVQFILTRTLGSWHHVKIRPVAGPQGHWRE